MEYAGDAVKDAVALRETAPETGYSIPRGHYSTDRRGSISFRRKAECLYDGDEITYAWREKANLASCSIFACHFRRPSNMMLIYHGEPRKTFPCIVSDNQCRSRVYPLTPKKSAVPPKHGCTAAAAYGTSMSDAAKIKDIRIVSVC